MTGNPLYDISADHLLGLVFLVAIPIVAWIVRWWAGHEAAAPATSTGAGGNAPASGSVGPAAGSIASSSSALSARTWVDGYERLAPIHRLLVWLLLASAAVHAGLSIGHDDGLVWELFLADTAALTWVAWRLVSGGRWRLVGGLVLLGSILAYLPALLGEAPDQVGLATKLVELTALAIVIRSPGARVVDGVEPSRVKPGHPRLRGVLGSSAIVGLVVLTAVYGWIGAFRASAEAAGGGHDHDPGAVPPPGTVMPPLDGTAATTAEVAAADRLHAEVVAAIARYADPTVAASDGYQVSGIAGVDFHAMNPRFEHDGRVLDPARPEALVYGRSPNGPVLLGAMFEMPRIGESGPDVGGPLTVWHAHEKLCFSLVPPALTGIESPLGACPIGSLEIPTTTQMIHVWTAPGAPESFGDWPEAARKAFVADWRP